MPPWKGISPNLANFELSLTLTLTLTDEMRQSRAQDLLISRICFGFASSRSSLISYSYIILVARPTREPADKPTNQPIFQLECWLNAQSSCEPPFLSPYSLGSSLDPTSLQNYHFCPTSSTHLAGCCCPGAIFLPLSGSRHRKKRSKRKGNVCMCVCLCDIYI